MVLRNVHALHFADPSHQLWPLLHKSARCSLVDQVSAAVRRRVFALSRDRAQ